MSARPIPVWVGTVDATGTLRLQAHSLFQHYVQTLRNRPVQLVLRKRVRPKSLSQLGYLWGVIYPIAAESFGYMDYEVEALHDACMRELRGLKPEPNPLKVRISLAEMSHEEVSDYISDLRHWLLTEHGIITPDAEKAEPSRAGRVAA